MLIITQFIEHSFPLLLALRFNFHEIAIKVKNKFLKVSFGKLSELENSINVKIILSLKLLLFEPQNHDVFMKVLVLGELLEELTLREKCPNAGKYRPRKL